MSGVQAAFLSESNGLLDRLESALLHLERSPHALTGLDEAFRAAHTLKGNAAVVDAIEIEWFAHVLESVLDRVRASTLAVSPHVVSTLLACGDHLRFLIGLSALDEPTPDFAQEDRARLIGELVPYLGGEIPPVEADVHPEQHWLISLRFSHDVMQQGMDPSYFLRYLESLGRIVSLRIDDSALPPRTQFEPELCYLRFDVELESPSDKQAIEDVFACVRESCELRIHPPRQRVHSIHAGLRALPDHELRMGEMLVRVGALTADELAGALRVQRVGGEDKARSIGSILVDQGFVPPEVVQAAAVRQAEIRERISRDGQTVKLPLERIDRLVDMLEDLAGGLRGGDQERARAALGLARQLRGVSVEDCFARLERTVRDLAMELGKEVDLTLAGAELYIDRALADALGNAVTHLVRNALDHGIETPGARLLAGKPRRGSLNLTLQATPQGLLLELTDDGRGIDTAALREVGVRRGLIAPGTEPERAVLLEMIFAPGVSTREEVGRYSGRGVGLDAVKEIVQGLGGTLSVDSVPGEGSRFGIALPGHRPLPDGLETPHAGAPLPDIPFPERT